MRLLEELLIRTLGDFGLAAVRKDKLTGVWLMDGMCQKIAAMGVRIVRGVTMHGFALNVNTDLTYFDLINPCGFASAAVTSMAKELARDVDLQEVRLDQPIQAQVTVTLVGEAVGSREGGVLSQVSREINVEALPMEVP
jgi:lipoate-protein ligase B